MNRLKIHVFDERIMNDPMSSYDQKVYKKLSSASTGIHILTGDDGSYLICFSNTSATEIIPSSLLDNIQKLFTSKGGVVISEVSYHINSKNPSDIVMERWFNVLVSDINARQNGSFPPIGLNVIDDCPKKGSVVDFSPGNFLKPEQPQVMNYQENVSPFEAAMRGLSSFTSPPVSQSNNDLLFDDIDWGGSRRNDAIDDDDEDDQGYYDRLQCVQQRKAEKRWNKSHILTADKETIKHDSEVIREILKEIAPGDEPWLVFWRAKMEKRIMRCMVITKDELEDLERSGSINKIFDTTKSTLAFAASAINVVSGAASLIGRSKL